MVRAASFILLTSMDFSTSWARPVATGPVACPAAKLIAALVVIAQMGDETAAEAAFESRAAASAAAGKQIPATTELVFGETDESNPFVPVEQMMPFLPFVRVRNVDEAIAKAQKAEHGFRHTSIIHSNNVRNMTKMGRVMDTTLFVKVCCSVVCYQTVNSGGVRGQQ